MTHQLLLYLSAVLALSLFPGPDMLFIMNQSLRYGKRYGIAAALGVCCGCFVHIFAVSLGLSSLLLKSPIAFTIVKYLGACYLLFIGFSSLLSKQPLTFNSVAPITVTNFKKVFLQGFMTNALNPKVALFFLAFLPQFVVPHSGVPMGLQMIILGLLFNGLGTVVNLGVGFFFGIAKQWLMTFPRIFKLQQKVTGAILIGVGVRLALFQIV